MRRIIGFTTLSVIALAVGIGYWNQGTISNAKPDDKPRKAFGIDKRVPWTTSKVKARPEPPPVPHGERVSRSSSSRPLDLVPVPGHEPAGRRRAARQDLHVRQPARTSTRSTCSSTSRTTSTASPFTRSSPRTASSTSRRSSNPTSPDGTHLVRFTVKKTDPPEADPDPKKVILEWPSGGHNGGCLQFGPDGYLYIVTGDGSGIADDLRDRPGPQRPARARSCASTSTSPTTGKDYGDPEGQSVRRARRAPGRRSGPTACASRGSSASTRKTGDLWGGEVGQDLWEMVYRIEKGGNYGWSVRKATHPFRPERKKGPTPILKPVVEHTHSEFRSHHRRLRLSRQAAAGAEGRLHLRRLRHRPGLDAPLRRRQEGHATTASWPTRTLRIVACGEDADGELYARRLHRRRHPSPGHRAAARPTSAEVPAQAQRDRPVRLDEGPQAGAGLIPYSVNAELWSRRRDQGALPRHPGRRQDRASTTMTYPQPAPGRCPAGTSPTARCWSRPSSWKWSRQPGKPQRLETRLLHFEQHRRHRGSRRPVLARLHLRLERRPDRRRAARRQGPGPRLHDQGRRGTGGKRKQTWHFPSRAECTLCHTMPPSSPSASTRCR